MWRMEEGAEAKYFRVLSVGKSYNMFFPFPIMRNQHKSEKKSCR